MADYTAAPNEAPPATPADSSEPALVDGMSTRTYRALWVLVIAGILGALGDAMMNTRGIGVNLFVWTIGLAIGIEWLYLKLRPDAPMTRRVWLAIALVAAALVAWRDAPLLAALALTAWLSAFGLMVSREVVGWWPRPGLWEQVRATIVTGTNAMFGGLLLLGVDIRWREVATHGRSSVALAVGRGVILALPLLIVFGVLLVAADAAFYGIVVNILRIDIVDLIVHLTLISVFAWSLAGGLRGLIMGSDGESPKPLSPPLRLGAIEIGIMLGVVDLLFLAFVAVQFRYFFGGAALVETSMTLTYAEYARSGFFELVTVAALVLPLLLGCHWVLPDAAPGSNSGGRRLYRVLAGLQVALLFVMMYSALERMRLYVAEFGMTELRFYTTAFMVWLAVVFVWFVATVLTERRVWFGVGALSLGYLAIVVLHVISPDGYIAAYNVDRFRATGKFDPRYHGSLSADAVPVLAAATAELAPDLRQPFQAMFDRRFKTPLTDWRQWNFARETARATAVGYTRLPEAPPRPATPSR